jgi:hypothetical protein
MKMFSTKKIDTFPKLGDMADIYINRIYKTYNMDSNTYNLMTITDFFKSFISLSEEDFEGKIKNIKKRNQEFRQLYYLVNGDKCAVEVILHNTKNTVKPEYMDDYVQYMKNSAITRLNKAIKKLEEEIDEKSNKNNFKN